MKVTPGSVPMARSAASRTSRKTRSSRSPRAAACSSLSVSSVVNPERMLGLLPVVQLLDLGIDRQRAGLRRRPQQCFLEPRLLLICM